MPYRRYREVGPTTTFNNTGFIFPALSSEIDLAAYGSRSQLEASPIHVMVNWVVLDESESIGISYKHHFTVFYTGSFYAFRGTNYSLECPIMTSSGNDWGDFELGTEGTYPSFSGDKMQIITSVRSPNGIALKIASYVEIYGGVE